MNLSVTYLHHCSFIVETQNYQLVFDWIKGDIPETEKTRVCFITHSHLDHFNRKIFEVDFDAWIVSSDVNSNESMKVSIVDQNDSLHLLGLKVEVLGSTDLGCSYYVEVDGLKLFYAGDLNNWHWKNESTETEIDEMNEWYLSLIEPLKEKEVDVLFIDIDPRLKVDYDLGALQLLEIIQPSIVFPMHFTSDIDAFKKYLESTQIEALVPLIEEGTSFQFELEKDYDSTIN